MKVAKFFLLGFQVVVIGLVKNKIQDQEPGADPFVGKMATIAKIVLVDERIKGACEQVVDQGMTREPRSPDVAMSKGFGGQAGAHTPAIDPGKIKELPLGEVPGMGGDEVNEPRFGRGITVAFDGLDVIGTNAHSERMSCMISGSARAGRRRAASSAKA